jgi:hypothetical protein
MKTTLSLVILLCISLFSVKAQFITTYETIGNKTFQYDKSNNNKLLFIENIQNKINIQAGTKLPHRSCLDFGTSGESTLLKEKCKIIFSEARRKEIGREFLDITVLCSDLGDVLEVHFIFHNSNTTKITVAEFSQLEDELKKGKVKISNKCIGAAFLVGSGWAIIGEL